MNNLIEDAKRLGTDVWLKKHPHSKRLIKQLMKKFATAYYEGNALISDADFDVLIDLLKLIDKNDPYLTTPGWGYKIKNGFKHLYERINTIPYYYDYSQASKIIGNKEIIITPKFDGINVVIYFRNGKFYRLISRGNGYFGKNMSWSFKNKISINDNLKGKTFALNCEAIYLKANCTSCRDNVACYLNKHSNLNDEEISFVPFGLQNLNINNYYEECTYLSKLSSTFTYELFKELPSEEELRNIYKRYKKLYNIDGLVITSIDKSTKIAFKYKGRID